MQGKVYFSFWKLGIAIIIAAILTLGVLINQNQEFRQSTFEQISKQPYFAPGDEFREQNVLRVSGNHVMIGRDCKAIIAETSQERADAIALGLANVTTPRPTAYDGWASTLSTYNISFEAVTLYGHDNDTYFSRAIFRSSANVLDLDMRPSDAFALALRTGTPIYLNMTLLKEVGEKIC